jgi:hypothetical protein
MNSLNEKQISAVRMLIFISLVNTLREYHTLIKDSLKGRNKQVVNNMMSKLNVTFKQFEREGLYEHPVHTSTVEALLKVLEELELEIEKIFNDTTPV